MEPTRLLLFTTLWTAIWAAPLPKLARRVELVAGLIAVHSVVKRSSRVGSMEQECSEGPTALRAAKAGLPGGQ
ncbi:MAG: hypothetical protein ACKO3G_10445, partial [Planctomycetaceae bacterium]